jgi:hypothetical protein
MVIDSGEVVSDGPIDRHRPGGENPPEHDARRQEERPEKEPPDPPDGHGRLPAQERRLRNCANHRFVLFTFRRGREDLLVPFPVERIATDRPRSRSGMRVGLKDGHAVFPLSQYADRRPEHPPDDGFTGIRIDRVVAPAFLYRLASPAWREERWSRTLRLGGWIFVLSYLFWEFFTPFNLFGEPLSLIGLELVFWWVTALSEAVAIVFVYERWVGHAGGTPEAARNSSLARGRYLPSAHDRRPQDRRCGLPGRRERSGNRFPFDPPRTESPTVTFGKPDVAVYDPLGIR